MICMLELRRTSMHAEDIQIAADDTHGNFYSQRKFSHI